MKGTEKDGKVKDWKERIKEMRKAGKKCRERIEVRKNVIRKDRKEK
jgi:hypothetical protein